MKTYSAKPSDIDKKWWIIDAKDLILGRLASQTAILLRGKHKSTFTPHMDCGDNVIIINAKHVHLTGNKADPKNGKMYYRHTGFPGMFMQKVYIRMTGSNLNYSTSQVKIRKTRITSNSHGSINTRKIRCKRKSC